MLGVDVDLVILLKIILYVIGMCCDAIFIEKIEAKSSPFPHLARTLDAQFTTYERYFHDSTEGLQCFKDVGMVLKSTVGRGVEDDFNLIQYARIVENVERMIAGIYGVEEFSVLWINVSIVLVCAIEHDRIRVFLKVFFHIVFITLELRLSPPFVGFYGFKSDGASDFENQVVIFQIVHKDVVPVGCQIIIIIITSPNINPLAPPKYNSQTTT